MTTSQEREQAFILLFEKSFNEDVESQKLFDLAVESEVITSSSYTIKLYETTLENIEEIDEGISKYLKGWTLNRVSKVALAILRLAVCELKYFEKVPVGVAISEAIKLCKTYASEEDSSFVNGVLGSFARGEK